MHRSSLAIAGCLTALIVAVGGGYPSPASAQAELGQQALDHIDDLQGAMEARGIPANRDPVSCGNLCLVVNASEEVAEAADTPARRRLTVEMWKMRTKLWLLPAAAELPPAEVIVGTALLGWTIGTGVRKLFVHAPAPPAALGVSDSYVWVTAGQDVYGVEIPGQGLTPAVNGAPQLWTTWTGSCNTNPSGTSPPDGGMGAFTMLFNTFACPWGPAGNFSYVIGWRGATPSPPSTTDVPGNVTPPVSWPSWNALMANPTASNVRTWLANELHDNPDKYPTLIAQANFNFGVPAAQDPISDRFNMPDCTNFSAAACVTWVQQLATNADNSDNPNYEPSDAADVSTDVLDSDDAVMERDGGEVTGTEPTAGAAASPTDALTIYRNPSTMPTMTAEDDEIADTLEDQNPDTVNETNKKTIARTCRIRTTAASLSPDDCTTLPILIQGSDTPGTTRNEIVALSRHPEWVLLHHRERTTRPSPAWYFNQAEPSPGCLTAEKPAPVDGRAAECDEFPFWSTLQAQGASMSFGRVPAIRWVPFADNNRQASILRQFYSNRTPGTSVHFHGCNIAAEPNGTILPTAGSTFLNIPIHPAVKIRGTGICNGGATP
jgi:hypothetical protein